MGVDRASELLSLRFVFRNIPGLFRLFSALSPSGANITVLATVIMRSGPPLESGPEQYLTL